ncbi:MAG: SIR2 family protein [Chloroflexota bacterium]
MLDATSYDAHKEDDYPIIVKLCGRGVSSEPDSVVVTEDQFLSYLPSRTLKEMLPPSVVKQVKKRSYLFFGHSLQSWHLRLVWQRLPRPKKRKTERHWAILPTGTLIEKKFWDHHDIEPIDAATETVVAYINEQI